MPTDDATSSQGFGASGSGQAKPSGPATSQPTGKGASQPTGSATSQPTGKSASAPKASDTAKPVKSRRIFADSITIDPHFKQILETLGVDKVLTEVSQRRRYLAPFEMRAAVNPQGTAQLAEQEYARYVPLFDGWRNVLVVLPLTITWLSLGLAALAYNQSLPLIKDQTKPDFFQLWQQGFPQLSVVQFLKWRIPLVVGSAHIHYLTFTDVALLDVAILLVMLLLTAFSQLTIASAARRSRALEKYLTKQLHTLSLESMLWSVNQADDQPAWMAQVVPAIEALTGTLSDIDTSVGAFGKTLTDQGEVVKAAVAQTGNVPTAVTELLEIYKQAAKLQDALVAALPAIQKNLNSVDENQTKTAASWINLMQQLRIAVDVIAHVGNRLTGSNEFTSRLYESDRQWNDAIDETPEPWWRRVLHRWPFA